MFDALAGLALPWDLVTVFQVDERVAPDGDNDRNATQLAAHLLRHVEIRKGSLHLMAVTSTDLEKAAAEYAALIDAAPLDIVHLGLGDDGHTASWPPSSSVMQRAESVAVTDVFNGRVRMTLTPAAVNTARARLVQVVGASKSARVRDWMLRADLPIQHVRRTGTTLLLDKAAAADLPSVAMRRR